MKVEPNIWMKQHTGCSSEVEKEGVHSSDNLLSGMFSQFIKMNLMKELVKILSEWAMVQFMKERARARLPTSVNFL